MKATLFRDMAEENWMSMDLYADHLTRSLSDRFALEATFQVVQPVSPFSRVPFAHLPHKWRKLADEYLARYLYCRFVAARSESDIYHVLDHSYGHLVNALQPERTVVTCHDLIPLKSRGESGNGLGESLARRSFNYSLKGLTRAARIIADSEATKRDIVRYLAYDPGRIRVIYPGRDPSFCRLSEKQREQARRMFGLDQGAHFIFHVGHCEEYKNIRGLLTVLHLLVHHLGLEVYLIKVGGFLTEKQTCLVDNYGLETHLIQLGLLTRRELCLLYNAVDLLLFPSHYEGFGFPVLEAMACGLPVVTSTAPSLMEIVGDKGITKAPNDHEGLAKAAYEVLTDKDLYRHMADDGYERAKFFSWDKTADSVFEAYRELCKQAGT